MKLLFILILSLVLAGCGPVAVNPDSLSKTEKADFVAFTEAVGQTQYAVEAANSTTFTANQNEKPTKKMGEKLRTRCITKWQKSTKVEAFARGGGCPVSMSMLVDFPDLGTEGVGSMSYSYSTGDAEMKAWNDITDIDFQTVKNPQTGQRVFTFVIQNDPNNPQTRVTGEAEGTITSQKHGIVKVHIQVQSAGGSSMDGFRKNAFQKLTFIFSEDLRVVLEARYRSKTGNPYKFDGLYTLNNDLITEAEFNGFLLALGPAFDGTFAATH